MLLSSLYIKESPQKGRGIFTNKSILIETIIEIAPVIVLQKTDRILLDQTLLHDYIFEWQNEQCCMALGWVPIYNHSYQSNCEYFMNYEQQTIFIKTVRAIKTSEELTINYNGDWNNPQKLWFDAKE